MDFLTGIPNAVLANAGAVGILALAVISVFRGWLLPKRSVDAYLVLYKERLDQAVARGDEWRAVADKAVARADSFSAQNEAMLGAITETTKLLAAMRRVAEDKP